MEPGPIFGRIREWLLNLWNNIKSFFGGIRDWFNREPVVSFLPGQIVFLVDGSSDINIEGTRDWANGVADAWSKNNPEVNITVKRVFSFPIGDNGFTVIFTNVTGIKSSAELIDLIKSLDNEKANAPSTIIAPMPHWLASGTPRAGGTGGPGSWPVEANPPQGEGWRFQAIDQHNSIVSFRTSDELGNDGDETRDDGDDRDRYGAGVHIAILDTMPTKLAIRKAYQEWRWHHQVVNNINDLLSNDQAHFQRAEFKILHETVDERIIGNPYLMRDHGLFVASIIHTLAPKATLHLYEVLNPYGVGSLESILEGLEKIIADIESNKITLPLIVNCSFTLIPPQEGAVGHDLWLSITKLITIDLNLDKVIIVAAAGNDAKYNNPNPDSRPSAGYPAAFTNVVGVGALPKGFPRSWWNRRFKAASYSNLADYMTLGGEAGLRNGVLGMYISDYFPKPAGFLWRLWSILTLGRARYGRCYPPKFLWDFIHVKYKPNTTGWAWWAGTSFAAAIFSGSLAALYNPGTTPESVIFDAPSIMADFLQTEKTVDDENVLLVEQR